MISHTQILPSALLLLSLCGTYATEVHAAATAKSSAEKAEHDKLPLQGTRHLKYSTDQVTWLSLAVSPTDPVLALEIVGDLYELPTTGGEAKRLTQGMAFDAQPAYSPDGETIAFVSDRSGQDNIWLMDADGANPRPLTTETGLQEFSSPHFAPDGQHVLVSRTSWELKTFELWAYHIDGGKGIRLTKAKAKSDTPTSKRPNYLGAVYSKDAQFIYSAKKSGGFAYNQRLPTWQIVRRDLKDNSEVMLTTAIGSAFRPILSPAGDLLVYATRADQATSLRVRNLVNGRDELLFAGAQYDEQESRYTRDLFPGYGFSADGSSIFVTAAGGIRRVDVATGEAVAVPLTAAIEQALGPRLHFPYRLGMGPVKAQVLQRPTMSPDGTRVAFSAFAQIHVHDLASGETQAVSPKGVTAFQPTWSPNGRELAYVTWTAGGGHVYSVSISGRKPVARGKPKQLSEHAAAYYQPVFSPDAKRLVALRANSYERKYRERDFGLPVGSDLIWFDAKGGPAQVVSPVQGVIRPHFGPEPDRIYYYQDYSNSDKGRLMSVRYDGTDRRTIFGAKATGIYRAEGEVAVDDVLISRDGTKFLVQHANQLYLVERLGPWHNNLEQSLKTPALPTTRLTDVGVDHFEFSADGTRVSWFVGHSVYQRDIKTIEFETADKPADEAKKKKDGNGQSDQLFDDVELLEDAPEIAQHTIELYRPRAQPQETLALTGGNLITMATAELPASVIEKGTLVIAEGRILAVGTADEVVIPAGAKTIDVSGKWLLPGFVDTHAHFRPLSEHMEPSNWAFLANLAYGVTTGIDVQPGTLDVESHSDMVDAGLMLGPRVLSTGPGVFLNNNFRSAEHAYAVLKRYKDHYGVHNIKAYISGSRLQRQWLVQAAHELKLMPTTEGVLDMKVNLTHAIDGFSGNEHNFPVADLYTDTVQLIAQSQIAYTPALLVLYGGPSAENYYYSRESPAKDEKLRRFTPAQNLARRTQRRGFWARDEEHRFDEVAAAASTIVDAGGLVGVGSHGQLQGLGYHWELWSLASGGMSNANALRAATLHGARMIGVEQDIGSLTTGKLGDVLVLNANPLDDLRATNNLEYVIKGGVVYAAQTLDRVWPDPQALPQQWWQEPRAAQPE